MMSNSLSLGLLLLGLLFYKCGCSNNCSGRKVLNGQEGFISDGPEDYKVSSQCEWLIDAGGPNKTIHLTFEGMVTECSFDFLFVYDGKSYNSRLIATLSGDSPPTPVTAYSGFMLLYLFSDRNYLKMGFEARYKIFDCSWNCSGRGACKNHTCHCLSGYSGSGCEVTNCPSGCGEHGECKFHLYKLQYCHCAAGYVGHRCNLQVNGTEGQRHWYTLQNEISGKGFSPRTSHTSVFKDNCIWVFGGFDLNQLLDDLLQYCMEENSWQSISKPQPSTSDTNDTVLWPAARSGHAMDSYGDGFFVFGGILQDGIHSNELWFFNITSMSWSLCATESIIVPEKVTGHTLTVVEDYLYIVGGKTEDRIFTDAIFQISAEQPEQWEQVLVKGGNYPRKRLVGHTTVYHKHSRSLIVFGGFTQGSALFSDRTGEIQALNIDDLYWSHIYNESWKKIPWPRALHSGVIMGNYLVIYGGNTHDHTGVEICYNPEMFFYHLGCHVWLNHTYFTGNTSNNGMPSKGRFGHSAVVANGNVMFIIGGYSGQVLSDLIAYKVPSAIADFECSSNDGGCADSPTPDPDRDHCEEYPNSNLELCQDDPECVFCKQGRLDKGNHSCVHKTRFELCVSQNFHNPNERCPGICPTLHTCGACVSQGKGANLSPDSPKRRVYIEECTWCVKEGKCQAQSAPTGTCLAPHLTESGIQGWWGGLSANLTTHHQCQVDDFPAGLHWIKYRHPFNYSFPDELSIMRMTKGIMGYTNQKHVENTFTYTSKFLGYIYPLNASSSDENLTLTLGLANAKARLYLSQDETEAKKEKVITMGEAPRYSILKASRKSGLPMFPNVARGFKYYIEQLTEQSHSSSGSSGTATTEKTTISLGWNAHFQPMSQPYIITSEFLEPYSNGSCSANYNCFACLTDTLCAWCEVKRECVPRDISPNWCQDTDRLLYLITSPSECPNCENYVQCSTCAADPLCEWFMENGHCTRLLRNQHSAVLDSSKCRPPCHHHTSCSDCITEKGECAWCENTRTCLPFSDYVTRYIYGQCTSWVDSVSSKNGCHSCANHTSCSACLNEFGCGWCSNDFNSSRGLCVDGDFTGHYSELTCSEMLSTAHNLASTEASSWSYDVCPTVNECVLKMHNCHANATCIDVYSSYRCECKQGFEGDGKTRCDETCYHECLHGRCSGPPEFTCQCDLGWTNDSCEVDCGCNNHSTCSEGVNHCDECQHNTAGTYCDECVPGSYGNPLDIQGCISCNCNGHGDVNQGECDNRTGECFCTGNTQGIHCEHCRQGYYGNPRNGGKCYLRCDYRTYVTNVTEGALGSHRGSGVENQGHVYCLWILSVFSNVYHIPSANESVPTLTLTIEGDMEIECGQDAVYVYNGIPEFISGKGVHINEPLGEFCGIRPGRDMTVYGINGTVTVFFEGDLLRSFSRGFNVTFKTYSCPDNCQDNHVCAAGKCVCKEGFWGQNCQHPVCPFNCSESLGQGHCLNGLCICNYGFGGTGCRDKVSLLKEMRVQRLTESGSEASGPSSRAGHTLTTCGEGLMFLFGGYSHKEAFLSDLWMYNVSDKSWTEIKPATENYPSGRYHHAAACIPLLKMIFIFGGFEKDDKVVRPTNSLWKFNIESHAWTMDQPWLPVLAGHTLTHIGSTNLILVGGFSSDHYFNDKVYEYNASNGLLAWQEYDRNGMGGSIPIGIYGHSAVYDHSTETIYMFGGYLFRSDRWYMSKELFTFDVKERKWNMLHPNINSVWENRVFHAAVHIGDAMVVIGGLNVSGSYGTSVMVYRYACNTWHSLEYVDFDQDPIPISVAGLDAVSLGDIIYFFGGFAGIFVSTLSQLTLPLDICALITDDIVCGKISGCQRCVIMLETGENTTVCYDSHRANSTKPPGCVVTSPEDKRCNMWNYQRRACDHYTTCSQCLATHPHFKEPEPSCMWCTNCPTGTCIGKGLVCPTHKSCPDTRHVIVEVQQCYEYTCAASDCEKCTEHANCLWSRHFQRSSEGGRYFNQQPVYNWNCIINSIKPTSPSKLQSVPPENCPARCYTFTSCQSCLNSTGGEGGSKECMWSETLQECMPPAYLPLRCTLGECHYVHVGRQYSCPIPCQSHKKCADCISSPGCGWCAHGSQNGKGVCMPGGGLGPAHGRTCSEEIIAVAQGKLDKSSLPIGNPIWSFDKCQPENECQNNHHTCNPDTQDCYDTLEHFRCECKRGYVMNAGSNNCEPVCHQGCIHGVCVSPDLCQCDFGWVGKNCSVECQCNKHSNCKSDTSTDSCSSCKNNTGGSQCHFCLPKFVGNPINGGHCTPCLEFCHNHTDICMTQHGYDNSLTNNISIFHPTHYRLQQKDEIQGPKEDEAVCITCQHNTTGKRCDSCTSGHFRKLNEDKTKPCRECHCNGHSNVCNVDTGENCQCKNNTETNCEATEADCWEYQCAQCKEYFLGTPTNGHQCYRQMNVDRDYCFDPDTQNNCNQFPKPLQMGRTVFFAVQPKYLNVDIRITIDVTIGSADVFISNKKDTFQVFLDKTSWFHSIYLDKMYASSRAGLTRRSIMGDVDNSDVVDESIREKVQLHESGSVLITDRVPDYLKLKASDTEFYKMSQFESMEKSAFKSTNVKGVAKKQKDNGTADDMTQSDDNSRHQHVKDEDEDNGNGETGGKKHVRHRPKFKKIRKMHHKSHKATGDSLRKGMNILEDMDKDNLENLVLFLNELEKRTGLENESVLPPLYEDFFARRRNMTAAKRRHRRGITVTDTKKESKNGGAVNGIKMGEIDAGELNTYITMGQQNSVLVVRDVRFRLVITLPRDQHDLRSSRFYIIVRSRGGNADNTTYGNLYFRQDQPHIDLFVFFSVFFSCFFLFLAVCVMLWKMKQTFDARRSRQMREREMECMASRPFARILVLVEHDEPVYFPLSSGLLRRRSRLGRYQNRNQYYNNNDINLMSNLPPPRELGVVPIAIEPTENGLAAVGTVLFQLPGGASAPSHLCLGSSLTTRISHPLPTQKSANLRRRTSASSC